MLYKCMLYSPISSVPCCSKCCLHFCGWFPLTCFGCLLFLSCIHTYIHTHTCIYTYMHTYKLTYMYNTFQVFHLIESAYNSLDIIIHFTSKLKLQWQLERGVQEPGPQAPWHLTAFLILLLRAAQEIEMRAFILFSGLRSLQESLAVLPLDWIQSLE